MRLPIEHQVLILLLMAAPALSTAADFDCPTLARDAASTAIAIPAADAARTVTATGRLPFHTAPDKRCKWPGKFLIPGDSVVARREAGDFTEVTFIGAKKSDTSLTAWVERGRLEKSNNNNANTCLPYQPASAAIAGTLSRETFPGRPNFTSVADGDEAETYWYLNLADPQCTAGAADSHLESLAGIRKVQLLIDPAQSAALAPHLHKTVHLTGKLIPAFTGHHHAPLLMQLEAIN